METDYETSNHQICCRRGCRSGRGGRIHHVSPHREYRVGDRAEHPGARPIQSGAGRGFGYAAYLAGRRQPGAPARQKLGGRQRGRRADDHGGIGIEDDPHVGELLRGLDGGDALVHPQPLVLLRDVLRRDADVEAEVELRLDRFGREIPDGEYHTNDFERVVSLRARTETVARHLTEFLRSTDRFAKTIVFCVDQEHADEMRRQLNGAWS